jgi:hypothetical protein
LDSDFLIENRVFKQRGALLAALFDSPQGDLEGPLMFGIF